MPSNKEGQCRTAESSSRTVYACLARRFCLKCVAVVEEDVVVDGGLQSSTVDS
jgi:hypothetical protein